MVKVIVQTRTPITL